jgi:hypothetical protein
MNKKCTAEINRKAVENCRKFGILCFGLLIAGFPGETPEMFGETRHFLRETPPFMISVVPWAPDLSDNCMVPVMQPAQVEKFCISVDNPSPKWVTLWKNCSFRPPRSMPWGSFWRHRGMDLQDAWDCIGDVIQDIHEGKTAALCEEYFLPRLFDDPLVLYQRMGARKALDFCLGLSRLALEGKKSSFAGWADKTGLRIAGP